MRKPRRGRGMFRRQAHIILIDVAGWRVAHQPRKKESSALFDGAPNGGGPEVHFRFWASAAADHSTPTTTRHAKCRTGGLDYWLRPKLFCIEQKCCEIIPAPIHWRPVDRRHVYRAIGREFRPTTPLNPEIRGSFASPEHYPTQSQRIQTQVDRNRGQLSLFGGEALES